MARLSISLLGPFAVQLGGFPIELNWSKVRALLAYLAVEAERPHRRETLSGLLWPDWPERSARTNLRNALSNLRKAIGDREAASPCLAVTREAIQFNSTSDCFVDVTAFDALASARDATAPQLERAIALYRGPFLDGFSVEDSATFEDWALGVRDRLENQFSTALQALAAHHERRGAYARACEVARRRVALAPWQEQAHQHLMRLLTLSGQRGAALAQFEACRRALQEELDVEPGEETLRLYERIREGELGPPKQASVSDARPVGLPPAPLPGTLEGTPATQPKAAPVPFPPAAGGLEGERRLVTALAAILAGRTARAEPIDVETRAEMMQHVYPLLVNEIARYGGEVDRYLDDGLIALFGASTVYEDDPERAVLAALAMGEAVQPYVDDLAGREQIRLSLRAGVSTGQVVAAQVGDRQQVWAEAAIDQALALARQRDHATETSNVWVAENTHRLVAPLFEWEEANEGTTIDTAETTYRPLRHKGLRGKGRGIPGLASPLVGRDAELQALQDAVDRLRSGIGGIVTVVGEAGIGKSRLIAELRQANLAKVSNEAFAKPSQRLDPQWMEGRCLSYGTNIAYGLWLDMLRSGLGAQPDAPPVDVRDALRGRVHALCPDCVGDVYPYLGRILALPLEEESESRLHGLDAESLRYLTFRAVETTLARAAESRPLVVVCEDLHWADPTSLALLAQLLPLTDRAPLLFVCILRPERAHGSWRIVEAAARDHPHCHTDLRLRPLSAAQSAALIGNLLHVDDLPHGLRSRILEHGGGNPFFVEEILRSLIDNGIVVHDQATGHWGATWAVDDIPIPDTLHGVLAARIDRLPDGTRRVLQQASVIGRIFTYPVLSAITRDASPQCTEGGPEEGSLLSHLVTLERAELIRERARLPEREYAFKHILTQEAAYNGMLRRERRTTHRRVAEALERLYAERVEEQLGLLAHHWEQAGENARAADYLQRAGEQAAAQFANDEAIGYLTRALDLTPEGDLSARYALLLARERVYELQGARQAWRQDLETLAAIASATGENGKRAAVACRRALCTIVFEDYAAAMAAVREAVDLAQAAGDAECEAVAQASWAHILRRANDHQAAVSHAERALALARAAGLRQVEAESLTALSIILRVAQGPAAGIACAEQALHIHRQLGDRRGEGHSLEQLGVALMMQGDHDRALARLQESLRIRREIGYRRGEAYALVWLGTTYGDVGEYRRARDHGERALHIVRAVDDPYVERDALWVLGRTAAVVGDYAGARAYLEHIQRLGTEPVFALAAVAVLAHFLGDDETAHDYARHALEVDTSVFLPEERLVLGHALFGLGQLGEAVDAYGRAVALLQERLLYHLVAEPLAGLARVAMADGDEAKALAHVNEVLGHMEAHPALEGTMEPLRIYLTCYQVLRACEDPRAGPILEAGYRLLQERAAKMDEDMRRSYLENVPYHRELVTTWEQAAG